MSLSNIYGQVFWQKGTTTSADNVKIDFDDFPNGVYILKLECENLLLSEKTLKIKELNTEKELAKDEDRIDDLIKIVEQIKILVIA